MSDLNRVQLLGTLTGPLEMKQTTNGKPYMNVTLITKKVTNYQGQQKESIQYHKCKAWGKKAELIQQYCQEGDKLFVEGPLEHYSYDDKKTGEKKSSTNVVIQEMTFCGKGNVSRPAPQPQQQTFQPQTAPTQTPAMDQYYGQQYQKPQQPQPQKQYPQPEQEISIEDIPF